VLTTLLAIVTLVLVILRLVRLHQSRMIEMTFLFIFYLAVSVRFSSSRVGSR
jgi:hypothetical protein